MATYVLVHGAGSDSWYWHLVAPLLRAGGHDVVAPDLPCDDDSAGLTDYADVVVDAMGERGRTDVVLVAQSLAGFTAPLVCHRLPVSLMVLVAAMVPSPGESPGEWWANTCWEQARRERVLDFFSGVELPHKEICIRVNLQLAVTSGLRGHEFQRSFSRHIMQRYLVVRRCHTGAFR